MKRNFKRLSVLVLIGFSSLLCAGDDPVTTSANSFAMVKVVSAATNTIVSVPWTWYSSDGGASVDMVISRLVCPNNLTDGDWLLAHTHNTSYTGTGDIYAAWKLTTENNVRFWKSIPTANQDRADSFQGDTSDELSGLYKEARGYGVWLVRQKPLDNAGSPIPFYLCGQYTQGSSNELLIPAGSSNNPVCTLLANPDCSKGTRVNNSVDITWTNVDDNDTLVISGAGLASTLCKRVNNQWQYSKQVKENHRVVTQYVTGDNLVIPAGTGFWFIHRGTSQATIQFK